MTFALKEFNIPYCTYPIIPYCTGIPYLWRTMMAASSYNSSALTMANSLVIRHNTLLEVQSVVALRVDPECFAGLVKCFWMWKTNLHQVYGGTASSFS